MRAVALTEAGTVPALTEIQTPQRGSGEVRVRVRAASVNGFDVAVANGYTKGMMEHRYPLLPALRPGGTFVSTLVQSADQLPPVEASVIGIYANPEPATLERLAQDRSGGVTRDIVQRTYALEDAPSALSAFTGGTLGKLVLTLD
jgi:NADPH:quinone reductase-like Zn-dependent oxidoreductase